MLHEQPARIKAWRDKVLAADARKAGSASDAIRLALETSLLDTQGSPKPLNIGKSGSSNMTDCGPQLAVEHLELRVVLGPWTESIIAVGALKDAR